MHGPAFPCPSFSHECQHKLGQTGEKEVLAHFPSSHELSAGAALDQGGGGRAEGGPPKNGSGTLGLGGK